MLCPEESKPYKDLRGHIKIHPEDTEVVGKMVVRIIVFFSVIPTGECQQLVSTLIMGPHNLLFKGNSYSE